MLKNAFILMLIVGMCAFTSCSNELSRDASADRIKEKYPSEVTYTFDFGSQTYGSIWLGWSYQKVMKSISDVESTLDSLQQLGYLTWEKRYQAKSNGPYAINLKPDFGKGFYNYVIYPTEKMKPLIKQQRGTQYTVLVGEIVFEGVTGITSRGDDVREVVYSLGYKYNELGQKLLPPNEMKNRSEGKAIFRKYDDGWRIQ
jgi:hypothetical protein